MQVRNIDVLTNTIYQIEDTFNFDDREQTIVVDIAYSIDEDDDGNDILEFAYCAVTKESNPELTADELVEVSDALESGREERYVCFLAGRYASARIRFDVGEYKYIPLSILYDRNAK